MKKKQLRKSEIKELESKLEKLGFKNIIDKKTEIVDDSVIIVSGEPSFFYKDEKLLPTLRLCQKNCPLKKVTVDMGAIKFITNGADVMRPGITLVEEGISKGEIICVIDEINKKPIALCESLFSSEELMAQTSGKVLKSIHYVGDSLWNF